jgi:hypothetical protein
MIVVILCGASLVHAGEPRPPPSAFLGRWQALESEFSDMGRCMVEEVLEFTLALRPGFEDELVGDYVEFTSREAAYRDCGRLGAVRAVYAVRVVSGADGWQALLTLRACTDRRNNGCAGVAAHRRLPLRRAATGGLSMDGVLYQRLD